MEAYEVMQKELVDLRQELQSLQQHHPEATTSVTAIFGPSLAAGGDTARNLVIAIVVPTLAAPLAAAWPKPVLRGDLSSPLSAGLEASWWPADFTMPDIKTYEGDTDPTKFLEVYETTIEATWGDDTTKA